MQVLNSNGGGEKKETSSSRILFGFVPPIGADGVLEITGGVEVEFEGLEIAASFRRKKKKGMI